jgi:predicted nucleotidyltransferase
VERQALAHALRAAPYPAYLFGSRLDDSKRGGDIDLVIYSRALDASARFELSVQVAARFRSLCDEKIDVQVIDADDPAPAERCFLATIQPRQIEPAGILATPRNVAKLPS